MLYLNVYIGMQSKGRSFQSASSARQAIRVIKIARTESALKGATWDQKLQVRKAWDLPKRGVRNAQVTQGTRLDKEEKAGTTHGAPSIQHRSQITHRTL